MEKDSTKTFIGGLVIGFLVGGLIGTAIMGTLTLREVEKLNASEINMCLVPDNK